jgi:hypothetical protein
VLQYINRARRKSNGAVDYWLTEDNPDPLLQAANAPDGDPSLYDVTVAGTRAVRAALLRVDLTAQVDGVRTVFTLPAPYYPGSLQVYDSGQRLRVTDFSETSATTFTLPFPPAQPSGIEVAYRPA